jgi:hypothetical protein
LRVGLEMRDEIAADDTRFIDARSTFGKAAIGCKNVAVGRHHGGLNVSRPSARPILPPMAEMA